MTLVNKVSESPQNELDNPMEIGGPVSTQTEVYQDNARIRRKALSKLEASIFLLAEEVSDPKKRNVFLQVTSQLKKRIEAELKSKYPDFINYDNYGIGQIAESSMNGVQASNKNQSLLMDLDASVQKQAEDYMSKFLGSLGTLVQELNKAKSDNNDFNDLQSQYNFMTSNMNYMSGSYSTEHNQFSNSETNLAQNINLLLQNVQNSAIKAGDNILSIISMF